MLRRVPKPGGGGGGGRGGRLWVRRALWAAACGVVVYLNWRLAPPAAPAADREAEPAGLPDRAPFPRGNPLFVAEAQYAGADPWRAQEVPHLDKVRRPFKLPAGDGAAPLETINLYDTLKQEGKGVALHVPGCGGLVHIIATHERVGPNGDVVWPRQEVLLAGGSFSKDFFLVVEAKTVQTIEAWGLERACHLLEADDKVDIVSGEVEGDPTPCTARVAHDTLYYGFADAAAETYDDRCWACDLLPPVFMGRASTLWKFRLKSQSRPYARLQFALEYRHLAKVRCKGLFGFSVPIPLKPEPLAYSKLLWLGGQQRFQRVISAGGYVRWLGCAQSSAYCKQEEPQDSPALPKAMVCCPFVLSQMLAAVERALGRLGMRWYLWDRTALAALRDRSLEPWRMVLDLAYLSEEDHLFPKLESEIQADGTFEAQVVDGVFYVVQRVPLPVRFPPEVWARRENYRIVDAYDDKDLAWNSPMALRSIKLPCSAGVGQCPVVPAYAQFHVGDARPVRPSRPARIPANKGTDWLIDPRRRVALTPRGPYAPYAPPAAAKPDRPARGRRGAAVVGRQQGVHRPEVLPDQGHDPRERAAVPEEVRLQVEDAPVQVQERAHPVPADVRTSLYLPLAQGGSTIGAATASAVPRSQRSSTSFRANSNAVPGPRDVRRLPSRTTRVSAAVWFESPSTNAGWHVASRPPTRPFPSRTTAGAAQMAPSKRPASSCRSSIATSSGVSRRRSAPGIPPGRTMASKSAVDGSAPIVVSATIRTPREAVIIASFSTDATVTSTPARRSTSTARDDEASVNRQRRK